jgi:prepilin-type N-terminal cleavage/methylation domain-containing protein
MGTPKHRPAARRPDAGFSLIEALIAAAILLIIALGLLPLFTRSINDNVSGNDASQATNYSRTEVEELLQMPFNNKRIVVPDGSMVGQTKDFWTAGDLTKIGDTDEGWWADAAGHGNALWNRTTEVRQYSISDLDDGNLDHPQPGGTQPTFIQLKEVTVIIENPKKNVFGNGQGITLNVVKPF